MKDDEETKIGKRNNSRNVKINFSILDALSECMNYNTFETLLRDLSRYDGAGGHSLATRGTKILLFNRGIKSEFSEGEIAMENPLPD